MDRLTFEIHDRGMFVRKSDVKTYDIEDEVMHTGNAIRKLARYEDLGLTPEQIREMDRIYSEQAKELGEYKNAERQRKLFKLPCAVGDTVYEIPSKINYDINIVNRHPELNRIYKQVVNRIEYSDYGYTLITCDGMSRVMEMFYKETWFLTEEEAETAMQKMNEMEDKDE